MNERQLTAITKIEAIKRAIRMMVEEGDIKPLAQKFLNTDLDNLELQIRNINQPPVEIEK